MSTFGIINHEQTPKHMTNNEYLASKPRYEIPDGLRGVAADFFFLLSGFVIGYAYDDRWDKMSVWGFFKRRRSKGQKVLPLQWHMHA